MLVTVIDHGFANLRSLVSAISHLGHDVAVTTKPGEVAAAQVLVLPGVGSFPAAMASMNDQRIGEALVEAVSSGRSKVLGICLGMQLLMTKSEEGAGAAGLDLVGGSVGRFSAHLRVPVPHIGFNTVHAPNQSVLFADLPNETDFYFVHAYRATLACPGGLVATTRYGEEFVSAFEIGNIYGAQFHPEKSQSNGLRLLSNFLMAELR